MTTRSWANHHHTWAKYHCDDLRRRYLYKLKRITDISSILGGSALDTLPVTTLLQAKKSGFSDRQVIKLPQVNRLSKLWYVDEFTSPGSPIGR